MNKRSKVKKLSGLLTAATFAAALGTGMLQPEAAEAACRNLPRIDGPCDWYMIALECDPVPAIGPWGHYSDDHSGPYCWDQPETPDDPRTTYPYAAWAVWEDIDDILDPDIDTNVRKWLDDPLELGEGYWMCITQEVCIEATCSAPTPTEDCGTNYGLGAPGTQCFAVDVLETPDSLDMIGHPFDYTVNWSAVQVACDTTGGGTWSILGSPSTAEALNVISQTYYTYNGNVYDTYTEAGGTLDPKTGYWVRTLPNFDAQCPGGVKLLIQ